MNKKKKIEEQHSIDAEKSIAQVQDPELKRMLTRFMERAKQSDVNKEAEGIKREIAKAPKRPEQMVFAFIPHEMAKVSIFFPMSDRELRGDRRLIQRLEHESSWGKIVVEGVKLAIFEEDIFLALMKIAREKMKHRQGQYVIETSLQETAKILYGKAGYTKRAYELIKRALNHFELIRFELSLSRDGKIISIGGIIQHYNYDPKTQNLKIHLNPHFCAYFLESMLTNINFSLRRKLKKDGSKALLRFLATHNKPSRMHILTVLNAINYNTTHPMYELRRKFKQFLAELKKQGVLGPKTKLYKDDTVYFDVLPSKKQLPE